MLKMNLLFKRMLDFMASIIGIIISSPYYNIFMVNTPYSQ